MKKTGIVIEHKAFNILRGQVINAEYIETLISEHMDNPLILALRNFNSIEEILSEQRVSPHYCDDDRTLSVTKRLELVYYTRRFVRPVSNYVTITIAIMRALRWGYVDRNPLKHREYGTVDNPLGRYDGTINKSTAGDSGEGSFFILGAPGMGKSLCVKKALTLFPQVVVHSSFRGEKFSAVQVIWIKLDCPSDASIKDLCISFLKCLDDMLKLSIVLDFVDSRTPVSRLKMLMKNYAAEVNLGLLVIDEIQNVKSAYSRGDDNMLAFFVELINTIGLPVILIGNFSVLDKVTNEFRLARKGSGQGAFIWDRMKYDKSWEIFCKELWRYQYTRKTFEFSEKFCKSLFDVSQGIPDIAAKAYMLVQSMVIIGKDEIELTPLLIERAVEDMMGLTKKSLQLLGKKHLTPGERVMLADVRLDDAFLDSALNSLKAEKLTRVDSSDGAEDIVVQYSIDHLIRNLRDECYTELEIMSAVHSILEKYGELLEQNVALKYSREYIIEKRISKTVMGIDSVKIDDIKKEKSLRKNKDNALDSIIAKNMEIGMSPDDSLRVAGIIRNIDDILGENN